MKNYMFYFICVLIINNTVAMKRIDESVFEDLVDGLNPGEEFVSSQYPYISQPVSSVSNFFNEEIKLNKQESPPYNAILVKESVDLLTDQPWNTKKQFLSADVRFGKKTNPTLSYSKKYTRKLFLKNAICDDYHCVPQWLIWCMIKSLKREHNLSVFHQGNEGSNFIIKPCYKRVLPVLVFNAYSSRNYQGEKAKEKDNNNLSSYRIKMIKVITDSCDSSIKHIDCENEYYFNNHNDPFLKNILYCANEHFYYLNDLVKKCHDDYLALTAFPKKTRYEKVATILQQYNNESVVNIKIEDGNALGDFFNGVFVCEYPFSVENQEKILYLPFNKIQPVGIFTTSRWIPEDVLAEVNCIKY